MNSGDLRSGNWFNTDAWDLDWDGSYGTQWSGGAIVENAITGSYKDGKIYCGENNNALVTQTASRLGVDKIDFLCNYANGHASSGALYVDTSATTCIDKYNSNATDWTHNTNAGNYMDDLTTHAMGTVPGGSLTTLTDVEKYYVLYDTFTLACTTGSANIGNTSLKYQIKVYNPDTGEIVTAGFSQHPSNGPSHKVYTYFGNQSTCQELADALSDGSLLEKVMGPEWDAQKQECIDKYEEKLEEARAYGLKLAGQLTSANGLHDYFKSLIALANASSVTPGGYLPNGINADDHYLSLIKSSGETLKNGIDGTQHFNANLIDQIITAAQYLADNMEMEGWTRKSKPPVDAINSANTLLTELNTAKKNFENDAVTPYKEWLEKRQDAYNNDRNTNGVIWTQDPNTGKISCTGYNDFDKDKPDIPGAPDFSGEFDPGNPSIDPSNPTVDQEASEEEKCYQNAKSLGWVICPVIYGLRDMMEHVYEAVEPFIQVNSSIVGQLGDSGSGLYKAWGTFRNMANIVFVILFLFVIFSQLTGFGIDNYGIKRMLPKLIITAILVNLSFIICAIAVDVSNVAGATLRKFFESVALTTGAGELGPDSVSAVGTIVQKVVGWIAVIGTGAGVLAVGFALEGWAIIIPILLFLLTVVIAVFFALIVLGMRQALVVILIVVAPLAFVCQVLPNTESIFKKWWSAAKGILMVYPVVSSIIGAGYLTASILLSVDQKFFMTLVAGILMVAPYFMIPSITRKALDAVGGIGTKLGNASHRARSGARNFVNGLDDVKDFRADSREQRLARRGERFLNSRRGKAIEADLKNGKNVSSIRARRYARAQERMQGTNRARLSAYDSMVSGKSSNTRLGLMQNGGLEAAMSAADINEQSAATKNWETMITAGNFDTGEVDEKGNPVYLNPQANQDIADALERELIKTDKTGYDANKVRALTNALAAKGKDGRDLMYNAVRNAQNSEGGMSKQAVKDFSSHILNSHGEMKDKYRSIYEFAKKTAATGEGSIEANKYAGIQSLTTSDMAGMDTQRLSSFMQYHDEEVDGKTVSILDGFEGSFMDDKYTNDRRQLAQLAYNTLHDEHLAKDLSGKQEAALKDIVSSYEAATGTKITSTTAPSSGAAPGETFDVHGSDSSSSTSTPASGSSSTSAPTSTPSSTTTATTVVTPAQTDAHRDAATRSATVTATATAANARATQAADALAAQRKIEQAAAKADRRISEADRRMTEEAINNMKNGKGHETDSGIWIPN
jgi:hypothetical protein